MLRLFKQLFCIHSMKIWRMGKEIYLVCSKCGKTIKHGAKVCKKFL